MKTKREYWEALAAANEVMALLAPVCERIEIAGSLRRECAEVGDIELVAIPKTYVRQQTLFDGVECSRIDDMLYAHDIKPSKDGKKYKQFAWQDYQVDLFLATPDNWGYILMLRTGPADLAAQW